MSLVIVLTNCSPDESKVLARALVEERVAACVNVIDRVTSFYHWDGKLCEDGEATLLIKTSEEHRARLVARLRELHSYTTPEIVELTPDGVNDDYLQWVLANVGGDHAVS